MEGKAYNLLAGENLGALVIGLIVLLVLFGIAIIQGYTYFLSYTNDRLILKLIAGIVLFMETAHSVAMTQAIYYYVVIIRGSPPNGPNPYPLEATLVPAAPVVFFVQGFFAFRIYRLSGSPYICIACWLLSVLRLVSHVVLMVEGFIDVARVPNSITFITNFNWLITLAFIVGAVVDVTIAASLCFYLKRLTPHRRFTSTSQLLNRLFLQAIQTGTITSITSIAIVICLYVKPEAEFWYMLDMVATNLYSNSFFLSLNMRRRLRENYVPGISVNELQFVDKSTLGGNSIATEGRNAVILQPTKPSNTLKIGALDRDGPDGDEYGVLSPATMGH